MHVCIAAHALFGGVVCMWRPSLCGGAMAQSAQELSLIYIELQLLSVLFSGSNACWHVMHELLAEAAAVLSTLELRCMAVLQTGNSLSFPRRAERQMLTHNAVCQHSCSNTQCM